MSRYRHYDSASARSVPKLGAPILTRERWPPRARNGESDSDAPCPGGLVELDIRGQLLRAALGFLAAEAREHQRDRRQGVIDICVSNSWQTAA